MARLAEQFIEAHHGWQNKQRNPKYQNQKVVQGTGNHSDRKDQEKRTSSRLKCFVCGKEGHIARNCRDRSKFTSAACESKMNEKGDANFSLNSSPGDTDEKQIGDLKSKEGTTETACLVQMVHSDSHIVSALEQGFVTLQCGHKIPLLSVACSPSKTSLLPVTTGFVGSEKVNVLRDTGCTGVVVRSSLVKEEQRTGEVRTCVLIDGTVRRFPLASISVRTPYYIGTVEAMCMTNPVYDLVLGNIPGLKEAGKTEAGCSVMKADKGSQINDEILVSLETETDKVVTNGIEVGGTVETRSKAKERSKPFKLLRVSEGVGEGVTVQDLRKAQQEDPSLKRCWELTKFGQETQGKTKPHKLVVKDGILFREFSRPNIEFGNVFNQVVTPTEYRNQVMKLAHESILGGHQGSTKTAKRVLTNFYWPGVQADIRRYCQLCDLCQRTSPKGRVSKVPLGEMPLIDAPFERIAVDLVGPIQPCSERGHRYILVMMDYATRYPEAAPLKSVEAEKVAEELVVMFTRLGIPREILTDLGSQFISGVMKEISRLLSIKRLTTTPYHPACNGLVERFNGVLKSMLKKLCDEKPRDWDRYIAPLLFAYRETPQESLGFAPFELLYGRTVRGPMTILRELWTGETENAPETKLTYQYVIDLNFQEKIRTGKVLSVSFGTPVVGCLFQSFWFVGKSG